MRSLVPLPVTIYALRMGGRLILGYVVGVTTAVAICFALTTLEVRYSYHHGWPHALRAATGFAATFAVLLLSIMAFQQRHKRSRG